jgi:hypothetical protein
MPSPRHPARSSQLNWRTPAMAMDDYDDRGLHKFILGYTVPGIIQLILGFCFGIGWIIGIIEGIIYLTKSDEEFIQTYQIGQKQWF